MVEALLEHATWLTPTSLFLLLNVVIATILLSSAFTTNQPKPPPHRDNGGEATTAAPPPPLARAPSLFSRVTSFNFSNYHPEDNQHHQLRYNYSSPSLYTRVTSFKLSGHPDKPGLDKEVTQEGDEIETHDTSEVVSRAASFPLNKRDSRVDKACEVNTHSTNNSVFKRVARAPSFLSRVASFPLGMRKLHVDEVGEVNAHSNIKTDNSNNHSNSKKPNSKKPKKGKKKVSGDESATFSKNDEEVDAKADDFINKFKQQLKLQRIESFMRNRSASSVN